MSWDRGVLRGSGYLARPAYLSIVWICGKGCSQGSDSENSGQGADTLARIRVTATRRGRERELYPTRDG
ncbi:hypothetical protein KI387_042649, partial [Taxus chinensis]